MLTDRKTRVDGTLAALSEAGVRVAEFEPSEPAWRRRLSKIVLALLVLTAAMLPVLRHRERMGRSGVSSGIIIALSLTVAALCLGYVVSFVRLHQRNPRDGWVLAGSGLTPDGLAKAVLAGQSGMPPRWTVASGVFFSSDGLALSIGGRLIPLSGVADCECWIGAASDRVWLILEIAEVRHVVRVRFLSRIRSRTPV